MTTRYERLRFHVDLGRACSTASGSRSKAVAGCASTRTTSGTGPLQGAPLEKLRDFDPAEWELITAEVRADKGTFVRTAWRREIDGRTWWVVIGYRDTIDVGLPGGHARPEVGGRCCTWRRRLSVRRDGERRANAREQPKDDGDSMAT